MLNYFMSKRNLLSVILIFSYAFVIAQNVGIGTTTPNASAVLEISSSTKGLLIPRVALTGSRDQSTVPTPAVSLLIYNTATVPAGFSVFPGYYYWGGSSWIQLATLTSSTTPWLLTGNANSNPFANFIGTTDDVPFNVRVNNQKAGRIDSTLANTFWGYQAGGSNTTGNHNTATGYFALQANTTGIYNTATGIGTLQENVSGNYNTANGVGALLFNTAGDNNTASGYSAL